MLPFNTSARSSASKMLGSVSVIPPFTVLKRAPLGQSARPIVTFTEPLTVLATARPVVATLYRAVDGVRFGVALQRLGIDFAVHRAPDEADAVRHAHVEMHDGVVVAGVRSPFAACFAAVRLAAGDSRIHRTDRDASRMGHDLDSDVGRVAAPGGGARRHP